MKIGLISDLHIEFHPWQPVLLDVEVLILAGDIHQGTHGLDWAHQAFRSKGSAPKIVYVAGNHEFYGGSLALVAPLRSKAESLGIQFLEMDTWQFNGIRFLGCTLWSSFALRGPGTEHASMRAAMAINDFGLITTTPGETLTPRHMRHMHLDTVEWLDTELSKPFDGKTVVITHFAPHPGCIAAQFRGSDLTAYFVSDMRELMQRHSIHLWCYGHTHTNADFFTDTGCRVVSNQRGYPGEDTSGFRPNLVLDI